MRFSTSINISKRRVNEARISASNAWDSSEVRVDTTCCKSASSVKGISFESRTSKSGISSAPSGNANRWGIEEGRTMAGGLFVFANSLLHPWFA